MYNHRHFYIEFYIRNEKLPQTTHGAKHVMIRNRFVFY